MPRIGKHAVPIREGGFRPGDVPVLPWAEIARAHELLEDGRTRGRIVLQVTGH